jgi:hypothetical protein
MNVDGAQVGSWKILCRAEKRQKDEESLRRLCTFRDSTLRLRKEF